MKKLGLVTTLLYSGLSMIQIASSSESITANQLSGVWTREKIAGYEHLECGLNNLYSQDQSDTISCNSYVSRFDSGTLYSSNFHLDLNFIHSDSIASRIKDYDNSGVLFSNEHEYKISVIKDENLKNHLEIKKFQSNKLVERVTFQRVDSLSPNKSFLQSSSTQALINDYLIAQNISCPDSSVELSKSRVRFSVYKFAGSNCYRGEKSVNVKLKLDTSKMEILKAVLD